MNKQEMELFKIVGKFYIYWFSEKNFSETQ